MSSRTVKLATPIPWQPGLEGEYPGQESIMELGKDKVPLLFCWCPPSPPAIPQGFWLARHPVTQRQWQAVMGSNPSHFKGLDHPVDTVSWDDAQAFCQKAALRLPLEAEWEHACRAGTATPYAIGGGETLNSQRANFNGGHPDGSGPEAFSWLYRESTTPAGTFPPNAWGLHDMHGQLWEWCEDTYDGDAKFRVLRGGSWIPYGRNAASSYRNRYAPDYRASYFGFRPCPSSIQAQAGGKRPSGAGQGVRRGTS